jgi:hypothetical protein
MSGYALEVHYGDGEPPVRIELPGLKTDEAETAQETLIQEVEHAVDLEAPLMYWSATGADPDKGVPIDPLRVTSVDLVDDGKS